MTDAEKRRAFRALASLGVDGAPLRAEDADRVSVVRLYRLRGVGRKTARDVLLLFRDLGVSIPYEIPDDAPARCDASGNRRPRTTPAREPSWRVLLREAAAVIRACEAWAPVPRMPELRELARRLEAAAGKEATR